MQEIKEAGIKDIKLIKELAYTIWPVAYGKLVVPDQLTYMLQLIYSEDALINQLINQHHRFIIVYENGIAVGFASYSPKQENNNDCYRLHKLYVLPSQQGKGTGKLMVNYIIDEIKKTGGTILELNVKRDNPALHFYHKLGFTIESEVDIDIGNGYFMRDYIMSLEL